MRTRRRAAARRRLRLAAALRQAGRARAPASAAPARDPRARGPRPRDATRRSARCELVIECRRRGSRAEDPTCCAASRPPPPDAIIATNTSGLAIAGLAGCAARSRRASSGCISSRPPSAWRWSRSSRDRTYAGDDGVRRSPLCEAIGKHPVRVRDGPGFFATRVFAAYLDEAARDGRRRRCRRQLIEAAGVANGRALGPLATLDETGIALNLQQARQARADGLFVIHLSGGDDVRSIGDEPSLPSLLPRRPSRVVFEGTDCFGRPLT